MRKGLPTVIVVTKQFDKLARAILRSNKVADSIIILLAGNPEFISEAQLRKLAVGVRDGTVNGLIGTSV